MHGKDVNSNMFPEVYKALGINVNKLGVVMLDTEPIVMSEWVENGEDDLYYAKNPEHFWIKGEVSTFGAHVTLLYGLLQHATKIREQIDTVLDGWMIPTVTIDSVGAFASPYDDEPYSCIVAHVKVNSVLLAGRARLELLPHINTFVKYRPHITLAYVKREAEKKWLEALGEALNNMRVNVTQLNYGTEHK